eukprot:GHVP01045440.1.p1 GENE.GHVP01045440.1~~GHVP01045440.1.p1  ORF type:complete len:104 (-),score=10.59 GHVP01045440.1:157-468(-)
MTEIHGREFKDFLDTYGKQMQVLNSMKSHGFEWKKHTFFFASVFNFCDGPIYTFSWCSCAGQSEHCYSEGCGHVRYKSSNFPVDGIPAMEISSLLNHVGVVRI